MFTALLLASSLWLSGPMLAAAQPSPSPACPGPGLSRADLLQLKQEKFEVASAEARNTLALRLIGCLGDPDPAIRDGVVFEGLSRWLRAKALSGSTILAMEASLSRSLAGERDQDGFLQPFAALVLSEVARADRIEPVLPDAVRVALVDLAAASLSAVKDYRGYDPSEGWRHAVAHGADLALQLGVNPRVSPDGIGRLMESVRSQVAPKGPIFYTFGEPERLARAVVFTYRRGVLDPAYWDAWFTTITDPRPLATWAAAFQSVDGLAKRHNSLSFLHVLAFAGRASGDEAGRTLSDRADKAANSILSGQ